MCNGLKSCLPRMHGLCKLRTERHFYTASCNIRERNPRCRTWIGRKDRWQVAVVAEEEVVVVVVAGGVALAAQKKF